MSVETGAGPPVGAVPPPETDRRYMRLALALGARHLGLTWPNPSVGAVVVAGPPEAPVVVAQGVTQVGGRPHAERAALDAAGAAARGATLYVSLEPCSHQGLTPPCADAVVAAGIARVVTAMSDPDPRVAGRGHARLEAAGVAVTTGVLAREAMRAHRGHVLRVTQGRPSVTLKLARTADGFASARGPGRLRITGPVADARVHLMRAHADAILVGVGTVLADDPLLTVRLPGLTDRAPVRVVLDARLRTPAAAALVAGARSVPTLVVAGPDAPEAAARALAAAGVEVARVPLGPDGRLDLAAALRFLAAHGFTRVFCEGGPTLADALARDGLVDEVWLLTGPDAAGGAGGLPAVGPHLARLIEGRAVEETRLGPDRAGQVVIEPGDH